MKPNTTASWPLNQQPSKLSAVLTQLSSQKFKRATCGWTFTYSRLKAAVCKEFERVLAAPCLLALLANTCCTQQTHRFWRRWRALRPHHLKHRSGYYDSRTKTHNTSPGNLKKQRQSRLLYVDWLSQHCAARHCGTGGTFHRLSPIFKATGAILERSERFGFSS